MALPGFTPNTTFDEEIVRNLMHTISGIRPSNTRDTISWRWTQSELFSMKSLYSFLQDSGIRHNGFRELWGIKIPLKVKIFVWLVLKHRVLTLNWSARWGWTGVGSCVFCTCPLETADHLFASCESVRETLSDLLPHNPFAHQCSSVNVLWEYSSSKRSVAGRAELVTIAASWWATWLERNNRRFESVCRDPPAVYDDIRDLSAAWTTFCH